MNQARMGLLVAAALMALPAVAHAQKGKGKKPPAAAPAADDKKDKAPTTIDADKPADDKAATKPDEKPATDATPSTDDPNAGSSICDIDPSQCPQVDFDAAAKKDIAAQMYAVQQQYALRVRRFEVNPYWSFSLNDQFVSHPGPGIALNYYITNVLAIGANFNWYKGLNGDSEFNSQARRAARIGVPLTEYDYSAALNFTYVPVYGKFAGFSDFIFHYDAYLVSGVGIISDRPIAVIDPDNRSFQSKINVDFNVGLGLRIFFNRWFAAVLEVRDYIFLDKLENTDPKAIGIAAKSPGTEDPKWRADSATLTNNVQAQLGISIFLPFSWEYRLPK